MNANANAEDTLRNPDVRKYFMGILESDLPAEEKYEKLVRFFATVNQLANTVARLEAPQTAGSEDDLRARVAQAAEDAGLWKPRDILRRTQAAVSRAVSYVTVARHGDGGWGYDSERSTTWATAHAVLALITARDVLADRHCPWEPHVRSGVKWLQDNHRDWNVGHLAPRERLSRYEASIAARCLLRAEAPGAPFFAVAESLAHFVESQNADGGWDATSSGPDPDWRRGVWSEVGATCMVLQALAALPEPERRTLERGVEWLLRVQNVEGEAGSWSAGSCSDTSTRLGGAPSVTKTCDGIRTLRALARLGIGNGFKALMGAAMEAAVNWVTKQEKLVRGEDGAVIGWGYDDNTGAPIPDIESTCLALETLVGVEDASLQMITANAVALMKAQTDAPGSAVDGLWPGADHYRITLAMLNYYDRIRSSPLFGAAQG